MGTLSTERLKLAWQVRQANFPAEILISRPVDTLSISVTGNRCFLNCAHCGGHYLSAMTPLESLAVPEDIKTSSCLISGGCTLEGKVPILEQLAKLQKLKGKHRYNFHVGLVNEEEIKALAPLADTVSFDFIGSDSTIKNTLHLDKTVADYLHCYQLLRRFCRQVAPHICLGLEGGKLVGETRALALLAEAGLEQLVLIVLRPTPGTDYARLKPPALSEIQDFLVEARLRLPHTPLILGCMRPGGLYRQELDTLAVAAGLNGIVQPAPAALKKVAELGLTPRYSRECCVL